MSPSKARPDDCFRALDEEFDEMCWRLGHHGVHPDDVVALAREILVLIWRRCGDRGPPRPLDEIAALVASDYLERKRLRPHGP